MMEPRLAISTFWIIILVAEAFLCLGAPFRPDPFEGMDEEEKESDHFLHLEVLAKLGVKDPYTPPSIKKEDLVIPDHISAKYNSLLRHHRVRRKTITQGIRQNPGIRGGVVVATPTRHVYTFDMSSIPAGSEVMMAELRIFKELPNQSIHKPNTTHHHQVRGALVSIHQVTPNTLEDDRDEGENGEQSGTTTVKVDERLVDVDTFGWKNFDVTDTVIQWVADPSSNMGLELHVSPERSGSYARRIASRVHFSPEEEPDDEEKGVPVLTVYTVKYAPVDDPIDCSADGSDADRCCRIPKYVDFRRTSWTNRWIIEPAGFESYDCAGPCHRHRQRHRTLREVFGLRLGSYQTCGVARYSSLPMMYLIDRDGVSELEVEEIPNMIVEDCECTA